MPANGPLLLLSSNPSSIDSLVISAHIRRLDYEIIVGDIPFFENLPNVSKHAIYARGTDNTRGRMQVVRAAICHLAKSGTLLNFVRGSIEADPAFIPEPDAEFSSWPRSLKIFLEHVPGTRVVVSIVSGVIEAARSLLRSHLLWQI